MDKFELVEAIAKQHFAIASNEDGYISASGNPIYDNSSKLLRAAIAHAYPDLDAFDIHDLWSDCQESIKYCADYIRNNKSE